MTYYEQDFKNCSVKIFSFFFNWFICIFRSGWN